MIEYSVKNHEVTNIIYLLYIFYVCIIFFRNDSNDSSILSLIKKRNGFVKAKEHEVQILNSIRQYMLENNHRVSTDQIVDQFKNKYSAEDTPLFKSLLSEICTFNRCPDKTGFWTLKPKYC